MLSINKDDFNRILMEMMQEELDVKIKLLNKIRLFEVKNMHLLFFFLGFLAFCAYSLGEYPEN